MDFLPEPARNRKVHTYRCASFSFHVKTGERTNVLFLYNNRELTGMYG